MNIIKYKDELEQIKPAKASGGKIDVIKPDRWTNGNWIAETKLDGVRLLMHMTREGIDSQQEGYQRRQISIWRGQIMCLT